MLCWSGCPGAWGEGPGAYFPPPPRGPIDKIFEGSRFGVDAPRLRKRRRPASASSLTGLGNALQGDRRDARSAGMSVGQIPPSWVGYSRDRTTHKSVLGHTTYLGWMQRASGPAYLVAAGAHTKSMIYFGCILLVRVGSRSVLFKEFIRIQAGP